MTEIEAIRAAMAKEFGAMDRVIEDMRERLERMETLLRIPGVAHAPLRAPLAGKSPVGDLPVDDGEVGNSRLRARGGAGGGAQPPLPPGLASTLRLAELAPGATVRHDGTD